MMKKLKLMVLLLAIIPVVLVATACGKTNKGRAATQAELDAMNRIVDRIVDDNATNYRVFVRMTEGGVEDTVEVIRNGNVARRVETGPFGANDARATRTTWFNLTSETTAPTNQAAIDDANNQNTRRTDWINAFNVWWVEDDDTTSWDTIKDRTAAELAFEDENRPSNLGSAWAGVSGTTWGAREGEATVPDPIGGGTTHTLATAVRIGTAAWDLSTTYDNDVADEFDDMPTNALILGDMAGIMAGEFISMAEMMLDKDFDGFDPEEMDGLAEFGFTRLNHTTTGSGSSQQTTALNLTARVAMYDEDEGWEVMWADMDINISGQTLTLPSGNANPFA